MTTEVKAPGVLIAFFRDRNRAAYRAAVELPATAPARIEVDHQTLPFTAESLERLLAYVYEDPKKCEVCRGKTCPSCGYKPRRVGGYEQLFFPRRVRLDLLPWDAQPGRVTG